VVLSFDFYSGFGALDPNVFICCGLGIIGGGGFSFGSMLVCEIYFFASLFAFFLFSSTVIIPLDSLDFMLIGVFFWLFLSYINIALSAFCLSKY
jgi:hypothetical protein